MAVDVHAVKHVAFLARITLSAEEAAAMTKELNAVLAWGRQLDELDTDGVAPLVSPVAASLPQRGDKVTDGNIRAEILQNAPLAEDGFFLVPKVVE